MYERTAGTAPREENLEKTLERQGGEKFVGLLRREYPELYKAVQNTRQRLKNPPQRVSGKSGGYIFGTEDSCKIRTLNYTPDTTLSTTSAIETENRHPSLAIIGDIADEDIGKSIDGFAVFANDADMLSADSVTRSSQLITGKDKRFIARSSFIVIDKDADGNNIVKTLDSAMASQKNAESQTIVKKLTVTAPMPVNNPGAAQTFVCYNRNGRRADYVYSNVKSGSYDTEVFLPFSGSVELTGGFEPDPVNPIVMSGENALVLQIENLRNGCANFNMDYSADIKLSVTGSTLTWQFPDNWHDVLSKTKFHCDNNLNFYCKMFINTTIGKLVPIVIQSNGEEHRDPSYKKIPHLWIVWGCFAKGTLIKMADGTFLPIEQIKIGDSVMTKDDGARMVTDALSGHEEKLVHIKTSSLNRIQVSCDHPILTTEGMVNADQLTAGTILLTEDGQESIESLYFVEYNDTVYNLKLDGGGVLIANHFYAGDFDAQNARQSLRERNVPAKPEAVAEEMASLMQRINQNIKNNL